MDILVHLKEDELVHAFAAHYEDLSHGFSDGGRCSKSKQLLRSGG
jgi:hypothetical protein